jgi:glycosyltransferase involved in cell wall biosynthesis
MNVCIITDSFSPDLGGIATFYGNLAELLICYGHRVVVVTADRNATINDADRIITNENGTMTKVILKKSYVQKFNYYKKFFRSGGLNAPSWIAMGLSIREWLLINHKAFNIEVIDTIDFGGMAAFFFDQQLPPVVITGHGSLTQYSKINHTKPDDHYKCITELEKLSFLYADLVLAYSPINQKNLQSFFGRPIGFSPAPWLYEKLANYPISTDGNPLVVAGLQKIKGAEILCEALSIAVRESPKLQCEWIGMEFYTAPGGRAMAEFLQKKFPSLWNTHFLWLDAMERKETIHKIANASFVIVPSIFETFNYVSIEAATMGKAIILTEGTGASYLFTHGKDAWVVPSDARSLAKAILHFQNNPALCREMGENAKKLASRFLSEQKMCEERISNYDKAILIRKQNLITTNLYYHLIKKYTTSSRKNYYQFRAFAKKIIKGQK